MIEDFDVKNFKGYEGYQTFNLKGLTVVSGTNNSGKSSLLQAIYLITQNRTINCPVLALNEDIGLGGFTDILNKTATNEDSIELSFSMDNGMIKDTIFSYFNTTLVYKKPVTYQSLQTFDLGDDPVLDQVIIEYELDDDSIYTLEFKLLDIDFDYLYAVSGTDDNGYCYLNGIIPEPIIYDERKKVKAICSEVFNEIRGLLSEVNKSNIHYIKAFRLNDSTEKNNTSRRSIGISGEYTAEIIELKWDQEIDFKKTEFDNYKFSDLFDTWIQNLLGEEYRIRTKVLDRGKFKIIVEETDSGMELDLSQVGFGISQILPILTMLLTSKQNDVIIIENPEVHLHPGLQAIFVDLCIFVLKNNRKIIIETHSDHIINRIRLRIKKDPSLLSTINILFFEKTKGELIYSDIEITEDGKITSWPKGFFDQSYNDLLGLIENE